MTQYHLHGEHTKLVFRDGPPDMATLEYNGETYRGRALYQDQTTFGRIISINLETIPDLQSTFFSLVVPEGNCPSDARSIPVTTFAVITKARSSLGGPALVSGQIGTYEVISLRGNAW
ncbi:MAG TPA: hypothetical protein VNO30_42775 [Kofleriaceae bacterium]|nr:hypothetical protein [Kofleriaceae bacterium]